MMRFTIFLLVLYIIHSQDHNGHCSITVWQPPSPNISLLPAVSSNRSLVVSWLVNHNDLVADMSEIQISRTENHIIIHHENVSVASSESDRFSWLWTSDLPLECADHSVRIRHFYNGSSVSRWSSWRTHPGVKMVNELKIFPIQDVLREGTRALFCCIPPPGRNITNITVNFKDRPLISLGGSVKAIAEDRLTVTRQTSLFREGVYSLTISCSDSENHFSDVWNYVASPPQKPRNISCETSDLVTVSCTWHPHREEDQTSINPETQSLLIENSDRAPIPCRLSSCTFPAIPQLDQYKIRVVVANRVDEEMESYSFNISDRVRPVVVEQRVSPGVTDASVSWTLKGNLTHLNVLCQVDTAPHGTTEVSCKRLKGRCNVQMDSLIPNTHYSTRIRCSVGDRFWGEWTQASSFTTRPLVSVDLWRMIKQESRESRRVTLLWTTHVPGSAATVPIHSYTVQWSHRGRTGTETKASGQNQTEVSIGPERHHFTVQAGISGGLSIPAHITIPGTDDEAEKPPVERQLSGSPAGGFTLVWAGDDSTTCGYTVEWCMQGSLAPCSLRWVKVPEGNTLSLPAEHFRAGRRYTFNIYGCTESGYRLQELQTGYTQEFKSVPPPSLVEPIYRTSSSVTLEWRYDEADPALPAFITGYRVAVQDALPGRDGSMFNVSVADPRRKSVTIEGLQENQSYTFSVSALTSNGPGQPVSVTIRTSTNYSAHLAMMLIPVFLLLGCIVLLWPQRKLLKKGLKEIFTYPAGMNLRTSELDVFLNDASVPALSNKLEECISCDIEIVNVSPPPKAKTPQKDFDARNKLPFSAFQSLALPLSLFSVPIQVDYCPQSAVFPRDTAEGQETTCILNKSYFHSLGEDALGEVTPSLEPDAQESCNVIYGYISKDTL